MTALGDNCSVRVYQLFYCTFPLINVRILFFFLSISLSHQGPARKPKLIEQGATIFTKLNDLNTEKNPSPAVT